MRNKYDEFMSEGSLVILEGTVLDMMEVYEDLDEFITKNEYDVVCLGFDPYNAREFVTRWEQENGPFGIEKVIQGAKTESVPLGELKKLAEERKLLFDEQLRYSQWVTVSLWKTPTVTGNCIKGDKSKR